MFSKDLDHVQIGNSSSFAKFLSKGGTLPCSKARGFKFFERVSGFLGIFPALLSFQFFLSLVAICLLPGTGYSDSYSRHNYSRSNNRPRQLAAAEPHRVAAAEPQSAEFSISPLSRAPIAPGPVRMELFRARSGGGLRLPELPPFKASLKGRFYATTPQNNNVFFTVDEKLQRFSEELVRRSGAPHVAIVAIDPKTGKILSVAQKSQSIENLSLHSKFPAASLFKLVTAAAALEHARVAPDQVVAFRGGTYTLDYSNYSPDSRKDRRQMPLFEALARSCNPVFGRIAVRFLSSDVLRSYAKSFGFNLPLGFEAPLENSEANIPEEEYDFSRTAAGFGDVTLSPIHAATLMAGIANEGVLLKPTLVDEVLDPSGKVIYRNNPTTLQRVVHPTTAHTLLQMMEYTTTIGTSKREFIRKNRRLLPQIDVAAKTGTLRGDNPRGLNNWFVAAAPIQNPQIALAVIVVNPHGVSSKASHLGRLLIEKFFQK